MSAIGAVWDRSVPRVSRIGRSGPFSRGADWPDAATHRPACRAPAGRAVRAHRVGAGPGSGRAGSPSEPPCGWRTARPSTYDHVVWVVLENHSYGDLVGHAATSPYLNSLAASCGLATNSWAVTHPSLPNYLAMVSGRTGGVDADLHPAQCPQHRRTLFDQVRAHGGSWRVLAESMPADCRRTDAYPYVVRHNPATYFPALARACRRWDRPMGTHDQRPAGRRWSATAGCRRSCSSCRTSATTPTTATSAPATTGCPQVVPLLTDGPDYRAGRTAVVVTWDEGAGGYAGQNCRADRDRSCHIVTVVISPTTRRAPGRRPGSTTTRCSRPPSGCSASDAPRSRRRRPDHAACAGRSGSDLARRASLGLAPSGRMVAQVRRRHPLSLHPPSSSASPLLVARRTPGARLQRAPATTEPRPRPRRSAVVDGDRDRRRPGFRGLDAVDRRTAWVTGGSATEGPGPGVPYDRRGRTWEDVSPPGTEGLSVP